MSDAPSTRRQLLGRLALSGAAGLIGCRERGASARAVEPASAMEKSRVVWVTCPALARPGAAWDRALLRRMLEQGLRRLTGKADARAALGQWVRPVDTVGLKVNCLAGRQMSTRVALVEELVALLATAGLPRSRAIVFDRSDADLRHGGFSVRESGSDYRVMGNDRAGFEEELTLLPSGASRLSRVATRHASVLINLPVLKDHGLAGISGALKNNFGLIHNPNKYHLNGCDPHLAEVNAVPVIRRKQRLIICDALRVQVDGGPAYHPAAALPCGTLLLSTDPVALDRIAWELLEGLRSKRKLPSLSAEKRAPKHIATAAGQGLGVEARDRIELCRLKVS